MLIGSALYIDVLKKACCLSLNLQCDHLDIIAGIKAVLKASKSLHGMTEQDSTEWPTVCSRVKEEENEKVYQGAVVCGYSAVVLEECADVAKRDMQQLALESKARLEWSDMKLLRSAVTFLDTQGWCSIQIDDDSDKS